MHKDKTQKKNAENQNTETKIQKDKTEKFKFMLGMYLSEFFGSLTAP